MSPVELFETYYICAFERKMNNGEYGEEKSKENKKYS